MPAATVENILVLPRVDRPLPGAVQRPVTKIVTARQQMEGAGFLVRRPLGGGAGGQDLGDPFLMIDHLGAVEYAPGEAKGAPWHPHRGFETITYLLDGEMVHHDSHGGGGTIDEGGTQWMTAGSGVLHDELPAEELVVKGGMFHGFQIWVNLPKAMKMVPPRYQDLRSTDLELLSSADGGALIRLIAGTLGGHSGPGSTYSPIILAHASISAGAQLEVPWPKDYNAMVYTLGGSGTVGASGQPVTEGQLAYFGAGDSITVTADQNPHGPGNTQEVLLLGGLPIREPITQYGPFVMNSKAEIIQAIDDYQSGKMGSIPAHHLNADGTDTRPGT
jgi:redox-sensitive bicupin YhaK (pirin superfamily)